MKEKPIIFSGPMVRAILAGRKTQTRRLLTRENAKPYPDARLLRWENETAESLKLCYQSPYCVGDRLWVRETARCSITRGGEHVIEYRADNALRVCDPESDIDECYGTFYGNACPSEQIEKDDGGTLIGPWRPSIHLYRWAARIFLRVTGVRVERVQEISEVDAIAEGIDSEGGNDIHRNRSTVENFAVLWNSIHGPGAWDRNDFCWVYEFEREQS